MENLIKYSASVISLNNDPQSDGDNYYADGRTKEDNELNLQVSIEKSGNNCLFCVFDDIKEINREGRSQVTLAGEIRKLHERIRNVDRNIDSKLNMMSECVRDTDNLLFSAALGRPANRKGPTAFAGLILSENKAAALNIGGNRVYLFRNGVLKHMAGDSTKMEKLLKLGIITLEQAKDISPHFGTQGDEKRGESLAFETIDVRTGDVFVILSGWLANAIEDERLIEILSESENVDRAVYGLVGEALKNNYEGNVTAMVIYINESSRQEDQVTQKKQKKNRIRGVSMYLPAEKKNNENMKTFIAAAITSLLIIALLFGAYIYWLDGENNTQDMLNISEDASFDDGTSAYETTGDNSTNRMDNSGEGSAGKTDAGDRTDTTDKDSTLSGQTVYIVQSGDSLSSISQKFYGDPNRYDEIMEANGIEDANSIIAGQELIIP